MELTTKQREVISYFWKRGWFNPSELLIIFSTEIARKECMSRLLTLKLIKEENFIFYIDRDKFLEWDRRN